MTIRRIQEIERCSTCDDKRTIIVQGEKWGCPDCNTRYPDEARAKVKDLMNKHGYAKRERGD